jgi:hypothetical protein
MKQGTQEEVERSEFVGKLPDKWENWGVRHIVFRDLVVHQESVATRGR